MFISRKGKSECVQSLLRANAIPLNDHDKDDMTPLHLASMNGHHRAADYLIQAGADIESR